jgi:hypothetical protein
MVSDLSFHNSSFALIYLLMKMARSQCETTLCYFGVQLKAYDAFLSIS